MHLIETYENSLWDLPEVDPIEMIKIRMDDFGYKAADLANVYGDKGTISKVLHYKQPLSLNMIESLAICSIACICIDQGVSNCRLILFSF